ncbi:nicotinate phosphoribosyltransferase [Vreelandella utahensis]|uniref:nicotinate phosphoribosyltransferase n=1 Tax=Vreelandella halophila TaxID=86177 RepID=UPI000987A016|nr:nicotinate phosphoribosyltransferase [Halomonas utahensis]
MLFTDLYELSMARVYHAEGLNGDAVFELFYRRLPEGRNYVLSCGQTQALQALLDFRVTPEEIDWLEGFGRFPGDFLQMLAGLRFTGDVDAIPEGSVVFPLEPVLRVRAPLIQAQLVETLLLNILHTQSVLASKAARVMQAAGGRPVMDFGARKAHGREGAMNLARTAWIAGAAGTSNVEAGRALDIPVLGTMAHSFVQVYGDEAQAFRAFSHYWPETTLLVDTWDTLNGVDRVIELLRGAGEGAPPATAVRLDSGDLLELSRAARQRLDAAGFPDVKIVVSSGLDEYAIQELVASGAPVDGFGVGTEWAAASDAASIDFAYKLAEYNGEPRIKASSNKSTWPGPKQVWRHSQQGRMVGDTVAAAEEPAPEGAEPLLQPAIRAGEACAGALPSLQTVREHAAHELAALPEALRSLTPVDTPYPVAISDRLESRKRQLIQTYRGRKGDD